MSKSPSLAREVFAVDSAPITFVATQFFRWFGSVRAGEDHTVLGYRKLKRPMTDDEITKKWQPADVALGTIRHALRCGHRLLRNGSANIFRARDRRGTLRTIRAYWCGVGWVVDISLIDSSHGWRRGARIFSHKFGKRSGA